MRTPKITKATEAERAEYKSACNYPLYGFVEIDGHVCPIEDLRGYWPAGDPTYEVMAPTGFGLSDGADESKHSALCHGMKDLRERVRFLSVVPKTEEV